MAGQVLTIDDLVDIYIRESKWYKNTRSHSIYESYKRKLTGLNLEPDKYETAINKISKIIGV